MLLGSSLRLTKSGVKWFEGAKWAPESSIDTAKRLLHTITRLERKPYTKMDSSEKLSLKSAHESLAAIDNAEYIKLADKYCKTAEEQVIFDAWTASRKRLEQINAGIAELEESRNSKDNNDRQAEALLATLKNLADKNFAAKSLLERFTKDNNGENYIKLRSLNISSFIEWMARGMLAPKSNGFKGMSVEWYRSNGADNGETTALWKIAESMSASPHKEDIVKLAWEIRKFYDAGQTTEDWMIAVNKSKTDNPPKYNKSDFVSYLSEYREGVAYKLDKSGKIESNDRSFFTPYAPGELRSYYDGMNDDTLCTRLKDIISLWWWVETWENANWIFEHMRRNPTIRAAYIKWLNYVAMTSARSQYFRTGKLDIGVNAEKATKLVELLKDPQIQEQVRNWLARQIDLSKEIARAPDSQLTPEQQKNILVGIDSYSKALNNPEKLQQLSIDTAVILSNAWIAAWVSAGTSLDTTLADSVTWGFSLARDNVGHVGAAISLAFTKELYRSQNADFGVHYGASLAKGGVTPFLWVHGSYQDFLVAITRTPIGTNIFLGMQLWKGTDALKQVGELAKAQDAIRKLAGLSLRKDVSLLGIIPNPAIAERMNTELHTLLARNRYDTTWDNLEAGYAILYSSILEVMNMEMIRLQRENNDKWMVMRQIGVNFGELAGMAYILPGIRFGTDTMNTVIREEKTKVRESFSWDRQSAEQILTEAGYSLTSKFDPENKQQVFTITPDFIVAFQWVNVIIPDRLKSQVILARWRQADTITSSQNIELKVTKDVKWYVQITVEDKWAFTEREGAPAQKSAALPGIEIQKSADFEKIIQTQGARTVLSRAIFWNRVGLSEFLTAYKDADISDAASFVAGTLPSLTKLLSTNKWEKSGTIKAILASFQDSEFTDEAKRQMIVRIRTALMTDSTNMKGITLENAVLTFSVPEGIAKNWASRRNSPALQSLASANKVELSQFDSLMENNSQKYSAETWVLNEINIAKLIGVVAGYKWENSAHGFSVMPQGMMSIAKAGDGKSLIQIMWPDTTAEKENALTIIGKAQPEFAKKLYAKIVQAINTVTSIDTTKITPANIVTLLTTGKVTIDGKEIKSTTQFYRVAFGECLNTPSYALDLGTITSGQKTTIPADGSSISSSVESEKAVINYRTAIWSDSVDHNFAGWYFAKPEEHTIITKPGEATSVVTLPGEWKVWPILVNGKSIGTVNSNGTITISTGTFRLAPGQTIGEFLWNKWLTPPQPITIINETTGVRHTFVNHIGLLIFLTTNQ